MHAHTSRAHACATATAPHTAPARSPDLPGELVGTLTCHRAAAPRRAPPARMQPIYARRSAHHPSSGTLPPPSSTARQGPQAPTASLPRRGSVLAQLGSRQWSGLLSGSLQDPLTLGRPRAAGPETWMLLGGATAGAALGEGEASLLRAASCSWAPVRRLCSRPHCGSRGAASGAPPLGPETAAWARGLAAVRLPREEPSASACVRPRHLGCVLPLTSDLAFLSERERSSLYSTDAGERRARAGLHMLAHHPAACRSQAGPARARRSTRLSPVAAGAHVAASPAAFPGTATGSGVEAAPHTGPRCCGLRLDPLRCSAAPNGKGIFVGQEKA